MIDTTLNWRKLVLVCGISLTTNCTQQSGMDAAQLHIYIRGDMIVIDGTYHVMIELQHYHQLKARKVCIPFKISPLWV